MNRTGPFRLALGRRRVRPYGFRMSELGWKDKENEIRNLLRRPVLRGLKVCLSTEESATPWVTRSQSKVSEWIVFLMKEDLVTEQSQDNCRNYERILKVNSFCWDTSFLFPVRESTHLFTVYDSHMRKMKRFLHQLRGGEKEHLHRDRTQSYLSRGRQSRLTSSLGLSVQ